MLGQTGRRQWVDPQLPQRLARGAQLRDAAVDQQQIRQRQLLLHQPAVAPAHGLGDHARIVGPLDLADPEMPVAAAVGHAVDGADQAGDRQHAGGVGDVEALDDGRRPFQAQGGLELAQPVGGIRPVHRGRGHRAARPLPRHLAQAHPDVAQTGGPLVVERGGGRRHLLAQVFQKSRTLAVQHGAGLGHARPVLRFADAPDAGRGAGADDVVVAVAVGLGVGTDRRAAAQAERLLQKIDDRPDEAGAGGEGTEVGRAIVADDAAGGEPGQRLARVAADREEALVVAQQDVVARLVLLDQFVLGEQRLVLRAGHDPVEVVDAVDEAAQLGVGLAQGGGAEVALHAAAERQGLADVDDASGPVAHEVAARFLGQRLELLAERVVHTGCPPLRHHARNSMLPSGPRSGEGTTPSHARPASRVPKPRIASTTAACTAGSRTTPRGAWSRPASNCGLISVTISPPAGSRAASGGRISRSEMKETSTVAKRGGKGRSSSRRFRAL